MLTGSPWARRATLPVTIFMQAASSAAVIGPAVAAPRLLERLQLGPAAVGLFVALVYLAAMVATQLGAFAVRRFGAIRASQWALALSAAGLALLALPWVPAAALGAVLIGLGYGPITPASSQMLARTTDPSRYALVFSIKQTGVPLGGVVAGFLVPPLVLLGAQVGGQAGGQTGVQMAGPWSGGAAAMLGLAALCAVAAVSAWPLSAVLDRTRDASAPWPTLRQALAPMRLVAAHPVLRALAACSFVFSMVQISLTSYMVSYLTGDLHWTLVAAGAALAASQVAGVVGRIGWGVVADRWAGPRRMLLALAVAMAACSLAMPLLGPATAAGWVVALLCVYGATGVGWNGVYLATVARLVPHEQAASATAGTLFFTFFGVVIGPPIFGSAGAAFGAVGPAFALLALPLACGCWLLWKGRWGDRG